ncbi:MAG: hypothetical protein WCF98_04070 [Synechococcus sp. ELA057]
MTVTMSWARRAKTINRGRGLKRRAAIALPLLLGLTCAIPSQVEAAEKATVVEILDGNELYIDQKQAVIKALAVQPQVISTRDSRGQISFNKDAAARINRFSTLRLGSSCFLLDKGQLLVSGKAGGCTRSARLSVRGTNYLMDVKPDGSTDVTVLEGTVDVDSLNDAGKPTGKSLRVQPGQRAKVSPAGAITRLLQLTPGDYRDFLGGPLINGFVSSIPGLSALQNYLEMFLPDVLSGSTGYTSTVSEVDACNQAQYLMPSKSIVKRFDERTIRTVRGPAYVCRVYWSFAFRTPGTNLPLPFPTEVKSPIIPNGSV